MDPSAITQPPPPPPKLFSLFAPRSSKNLPSPTVTSGAEGVENSRAAARSNSTNAVAVGGGTGQPPTSPPLGPSLQTNSSGNECLGAGKKKKIGTSKNRRVAMDSVNDDKVEDDEIVILPSTSSSFSIFDRSVPLSNGKSSTRSSRASTPPPTTSDRVPVIVIPDSPPTKPVHAFRPLGEVFRDKREKRKAKEPVEARWPTKEEHGGPGVGGGAKIGAMIGRDARERWISSVDGKGKGKAVDRLSLEGGAGVWFDRYGQSMFSNSNSTLNEQSKRVLKHKLQHVQHTLQHVSSLLPEYFRHPLLDRIAAPFRTDPPRRIDFLRSNETEAMGLGAGATQDRKDLWTVKYAPRLTEEVLGSTSGASALKLKAWLEEVKVSEDRNRSKKRSRQINRGVTTKKKRRSGYGGASDLDDFVASDDDEVDYDDLDIEDDDDDVGDEVIGSSSRLFPTLSNLILLVGPNGSGKTAAVHAVANELGWEVFEVYPGIGKRTAKDIERLVGDVGRNHTVRAGGSSPKKPAAGGLFAMFGKQGKTASSTSSTTVETGPNQSLILFEEVDVLYRDERDFWTGLIHLVKDSRRPIILTCTDTSLIPFDDLGLQKVVIEGQTEPQLYLPFEPPEEYVATSFLQLVALAEGHVLTKESTTKLYVDRSPAPMLSDYVTFGRGDPLPHPYPTDPRVEINRPIPDLRRALMQMQFECQWGVGDTGGIEWMDLSEGKEERTNWSVETLCEAGEDEKERIQEDEEDVLDKLVKTTEARSFANAFVDRRSIVALEDYDSPPLGSPDDDLLNFPTLPPVAPQIPHQLGSSRNLERSLTSVIHSLCPLLSLPLPPTSCLRQNRFSHVLAAARYVIPTALIDAPSPIFPSPRIFINYLPYLRQITAHEDLLDALAVEDQVALMGRRSTRSSLAAKKRARRFGWDEWEVELVRQGGFEGVEQGRWPEMKWEIEEDPIEDSQDDLMEHTQPGEA